MNSSNRKILYVSAIVSAALRYLIIAEGEGAPSSFAWSYLSPAGILQGAAVFVFIKQINWSSLFSSAVRMRLLTLFSSCSFGIYLIHMIVFYYGLMLTHLDGSSFVWRSIGPLIAYFICLVIVLLAKRIPYIRKLFP